jgi:hypothetical protein
MALESSIDGITVKQQKVIEEAYLYMSWAISSIESGDSSMNDTDLDALVDTVADMEIEFPFLMELEGVEGLDDDEDIEGLDDELNQS